MNIFNVALILGAGILGGCANGKSTADAGGSAVSNGARAEAPSIVQIADRTLDLLERPFWGEGEVGHFIVIEVNAWLSARSETQAVFELATLSPVQQAALKRYIDLGSQRFAPTSPLHAVLRNIQDYVFAMDVAQLLDDEPTNLPPPGVARAFEAGRIDGTIRMEPIGGMSGDAYQKQAKRVGSEIERLKEGRPSGIANVKLEALRARLRHMPS